MKKVITFLLLIISFFWISFAYTSSENKTLNQIKIFMEKKIKNNPLKKNIYLKTLKKYKNKISSNKKSFSLLSNIEKFLINLNFNSQLSYENKLALLNEVYNESDKYFQRKNSTNPEKMPIKLNFDKIFVTIYSNNKIRCCQAGTNKNNIFRYIDEATIRCIKDSRFGWELKEDERENMEVSFDFLYNKRIIAKNKLKSIFKKGIHAIQINTNGKSAYFKSSVIITKNYSLEYTLKKLCKKAWAKENCYNDDDTTISIYDTFAFKWDKNKNITDLYRYNILVNQEQINNNLIYSRLKLAKNWFLNNVNSKTWLLEYMYYPSKNEHETKENNHIRQLASMWIMTELDKFFWTKDFAQLAQNTYKYYLQFYKEKENYAFVNIHNATIANNAFLIMGLLNSYKYNLTFTWNLSQDQLIENLANGIIKMQRPDGSYNTKFLMNSNSGENFYPGEAMLALMKLYNYNNDEKYLNSVKKAFPYYQKYWRKHKNTAFIPWHSQADYLLYKATNDKIYADFVFEITDWILTSQGINNSAPDEIWWFPKKNPRISTTAYMEWINDAYKLAVNLDDKERIEKYWNSIKLATRFILQLQFTEENSFYLVDKTKAIWWFKQTLTNNQLRNDNAQHASSALMKIFKNNLFK